MRVVVVGGLHPEGKPSETMGEPVSWYSHSICGSTYGIAAALSQHGFDAYPFKGFRDREPFDSADVMFVSEWNLAEYVEENGLWDFKKPAVLLLHSALSGKRNTVKDLLTKYRGICFTRSEAMHAFARNASYALHDPDNTCHHSWVAPWGFPDWWTFPPAKETPYAPGTKNVVYAGRLCVGHRGVYWIRRVAERVHGVTVWVIANIEPGSEEIEHELSQIPNVRFLGKMPHGTFQHYLYYADVALDSGVVDEGGVRLANNCKLWDYLAAGVPVVMDGLAGGDDLIVETGLGTIVPRLDEDAYLAAVKKWIGLAPTMLNHARRDQTIRWMRENHTWSATVVRWVENFRKVVHP